jgi:hypothetical protein
LGFYNVRTLESSKDDSSVAGRCFRTEALQPSLLILAGLSSSSVNEGVTSLQLPNIYITLLQWHCQLSCWLATLRSAAVSMLSKLLYISYFPASFKAWLVCLLLA